MRATNQLRFCLILLVLFLGLFVCQPGFQVQASVSGASGKPVIFNYNEGALPGEAFGVQGDSFGADAELWYAIVSGSGKELKPENRLTVLSASNSYVAAVLPDEKVLPAGLLVAVWAKNGQQYSEPVFINRARIVSVEFEEIMPGYIFRVFGRNLFFAGQKPNLTFFDPNSNQSFSAEIVQSDPYVLQVKAPKELVSGVRYSLEISNGTGGKWGNSVADEMILARRKAPDPFNIKVPWGADFTFYKNVFNLKTDSRLTLKAKGDGKVNDREAIQQAIDKASENGGGVVFFPNGIYKLDFKEGCGLSMRSNVVLQGEGAENSIIQYGYGTPQPYADPIGKGGWPDETVNGVAFLWPIGTRLSGLSDLGIKNINETGLWRHSLKTMRPKDKSPGSAGSEFFAVNCKFEFSMDWGLSWGFVDKMVVSDCVFESNAQVTWPWLWHCDGSTNFVIRNNRVRYSAGRFGFSESYNGIIENNHITRLGDLQTFKGETGGFNIDYAKDIVVLKNHMDVEGEAIQSRNQGETILSQGGNPIGQTVGTVSSATKTTLTDLTIRWPKFGTNETNQKGDVNASLPSYCNAVAIVSGKGAGQWRYISGNDSHQLQIDRPWDLVPEKGSQYVIMKWSAEDWLVKDNLLEDNNRGIWFYCGGNDVVIEGNKLVNSEGIYLRADQRMEIGRYNLIWNILVENNHVLRTNDKRPAYICATTAVQPTHALLGTGMLGVEIRRNYVQALKPNVSTFVKGEGFWNVVTCRSPETLGNEIGILGTIFEKNTAINCDYGYRLSKSICQTIIKDPIYVDVKSEINESTFPESGKIGTVVSISKDEKEEITDPFLPYLTGQAPSIINEISEEIDSGVKVRKVIFKSYDYREGTQNKRAEIFAVIARPEKPGNYPGLLVLHGGGGCAELEKAKKWAAQGYVVVALDEPGVANPDKIPMSHGPWEQYKYGENRFVVQPDIKSSTLFSAVLASVQGLYLLQAQPDVIKDKIGITGISWGGYLTTFVSGLANSMITASFSVYGCGFYDYGTTFLKPLNTMHPEERAIWLKYLDAGRRAKDIKTPFFIAAAANDNWFWPPAVTLTLSTIKGRGNHLFSPNSSHKVELPGGTVGGAPDQPGWLSMEQVYFDYHLKGKGQQLPEIKEIEKEKLTSGNTKVRFKVSSPLPVSNAQMNYSQVGVEWTKKKWEVVSAKDSGEGWFEAEIPSNGLEKPFECYATIFDSRPVSVSSYLIWCE